jgi:uncharacterized protein YkwD
MVRMDGRWLHLAVAIGALCVCASLTGIGCGTQLPDTLGSVVEGTDDPVPPDDAVTDSELPDNAYCNAVASWDGAWASFEEEVVELVNEWRAAGADCGSTGEFEPAGPLAMDASLRCAARSHSMDMSERDFFDHENLDGLGPGDRLDLAEYDGSAWGENIAWGYATPEAVVAGWMNSPGHCANIMTAHFTLIGVGYYSGSYWTQTFGRP